MGNDKLKWLKMRKKTEPEYPYEPPIWLGPISNGEFYLPQSAQKRKIREEILRRCDDNARKLGMDRREFMASSMGFITSLSVLNMAAGCGDANGMLPNSVVNNMAAGRAASSAPGVAGSGTSVSGVTGAAGMPGFPPPTTGGSTTPPSVGGSGPSSAGGMGGSPPPAAGNAGASGGYACSKDATMNPDMARMLAGGDYFIMDMQTHHVGSAGGFRGLELNMCAGTVQNCTSPDNYIKAMFEMSETTVAVLSGVPGSVDPNSQDIMGIISNSQMQHSRDRVNKAAMPGAERMIAHCQVMVKSAGFEGTMEAAQMKGTIGWKVYPPTEGGWWLTDPAGIALVKKAQELFPNRMNKTQPRPIICAHKGFPLTGFDRVHADPMPDVGMIGTMFPDVTFVIYHSACEMPSQEGAPFNEMTKPSAQTGGTDRLWWAIKEAGLKGKNVYAEMGSAWKICMTNPMVAQHYVGKALKNMGTSNVVWGSETTWFGCPQDQIDAFKMLTISKEFQEMYGYPELTEDVRKGVFGLNGAPIYGIDPCAVRYKVSFDQVQAKRDLLDDELGPRRWALTNRPAITSRKDLNALLEYRRLTGEEV